MHAGNVVMLDDKYPHIRNIRDGTVIKLDVNNGVYTMDMWVRLDETSRGFSVGRDSEWLECQKQTCKTKEKSAAVRVKKVVCKKS